MNIRTEQYFSAENLAEMPDEFNAFDRSMIHEKYHKLYEVLSAAAAK